MSKEKITEKIVEFVGDGVTQPRIVYLATNIDEEEFSFYVKTLRQRRVEVYTHRTPMVAQMMHGLSHHEKTLVEKEMAYSSRLFLGTKASAWSNVVALMRLSRKDRPILPPLS